MRHLQSFARKNPDSNQSADLSCAQGSGLPPLAQARLNAPAIMRCQKIAPYTLVRRSSLLHCLCNHAFKDVGAAFSKQDAGTIRFDNVR